MSDNVGFREFVYPMEKVVALAKDYAELDFSIWRTFVVSSEIFTDPTVEAGDMVALIADIDQIRRGERPEMYLKTLPEFINKVKETIETFKSKPNETERNQLDL